MTRIPAGYAARIDRAKRLTARLEVGCLLFFAIVIGPSAFVIADLACR